MSSRGYDPKVRTAAGNRKRLRDQGAGQQFNAPSDYYATRLRMAQALVATNCAAGRHKPETDAESGNEVCKFCGTVTDDYADVAAYLVKEPEELSD